VPVCSLNPATLTLSGGGSGTTVVTISTTAGSSASLVRPSRKSLWGLGGGGAVLAVMLMCGIPARRRRFVSILALLWVGVVSVAIGCGGGGSQTAVNKGPVVPATTAGNYTFTITGTDASNSAVSTSTAVAVTVK
jgi:peptidoglycan/LPS O-acetylase OafA/YrhL